MVDVQYTDRRYLRKPKGSPPGFVVVDREKVYIGSMNFDPRSAHINSEMGVFIAILLVGYIYAWKRGALEWE